MVKLISKLFLALLGWCAFIVGVYGGTTLFVCWMLNFGRPL
jgi:hypothetical protein